MQTQDESTIRGNPAKPPRKGRRLLIVFLIAAPIVYWLTFDKMVTHLKTSRNNTDGIDGVVFEGTVARRILDAEVPGSGALNEVTADGLKSANKIDTLTESWAIQIKHKTTVPPNYGAEHLGGQSAAEAYLNQLVSQAGSENIQRVPLFITNCPITSGFQDMLTQRGILWQQVAP